MREALSDVLLVLPNTLLDAEHWQHVEALLREIAEAISIGDNAALRRLLTKLDTTRSRSLTALTTLGLAEHAPSRVLREVNELASQAGGEIVAGDVVADDAQAIEAWLRAQVQAGTSIILTTGGTGFTPDDVTPEATRAVIEREAPGIAEAMRAESRRHTPMGILSRGMSGLAGRSLIVNFPGNPKAIRELFGVIAPILEHAVGTLNREPGQPRGH